MTLATTSLVVERQYDIGYNFAGSGKAVLLHWQQPRWQWEGSIMIMATTSRAVERQYYDIGYNFAGNGKYWWPVPATGWSLVATLSTTSLVL